jgi:regulatory protein
MSLRDYSKAKSYCLRLIKFRVRSEYEIRGKLKNKDYAEGTIDQAIDFLKKCALLDDVLFAKLWVTSRVKKPLGLRRLAFELKQKGISPEIIETSLESLKDEYSEEKVLQGLVDVKLAKMKNLEPEKIKARLYGYFLRKGFSQGYLIEILNKKVKTSF